MPARKGGRHDASWTWRHMVIGRERHEEPEFLAWLHRQPECVCVVTGTSNPDLHHIRTRGAGGSDRWVIPLYRREHRKAHDYPAWWYTHRVVVAEWCAVLPELWERYDQVHV